MTEVMIDLETLSTSSMAAILTIGAIKFTRDKSIPTLDKCDSFYRRINLDSCKTIGLECSDQTIKWWNNQSSEAKYEALENPDRILIKKALIEFSEWFGNTKIIWSHGDDFDCVIIGNAFSQCGLTVPWKFWNTRDTRTLYDIGNIKMSDLPQDNAHHALHDCHRQIIGIHKSLENLKNIYVNK